MAARGGEQKSVEEGGRVKQQLSEAKWQWMILKACDSARPEQANLLIQLEEKLELSLSDVNSSLQVLMQKYYPLPMHRHLLCQLHLDEYELHSFLSYDRRGLMAVALPLLCS